MAKKIIPTKKKQESKEKARASKKGEPKSTLRIKKKAPIKKKARPREKGQVTFIGQVDKNSADRARYRHRMAEIDHAYSYLRDALSFL